ncbi:MlaE family lipid ABC transporter permease subunit [Desulfovibrio sp. OttesenSCG-928-F07]|nr:MlaE family lipid ABC transporter permease subunit [Desulfovibrio sp. OttesenSCG-928-F07]
MFNTFKKPQHVVAKPATPQARLVQGQGGVELHLAGEWSIYTAEQLPALLTKELKISGIESKLPFASINVSAVTKLDTSGASVINELTQHYEKGQVTIAGANEKFAALLSLTPPASVTQVPKDTTPRIIRLLNNTGYTVINELRLLGSIVSFFGQFNLNVIRLITKPWSLRLTSTVYHIDQVGVKAVPIVALLNFLIGMVIAYMAASSLSIFGAQIYVVSLLEVVTLREMAVLITAILVAGRSGSAFTAQIGAMVNNQEIDAMRSMGIRPMEVLVMPRLIAISICLPFLVIIADIMSLTGGMVAVWFTMDISPTVFMHTLQEGMDVKRILVGMVKAPFFAVVIGCVGCFLGFRVSGSSDSLGSMTTRSVVESIFLVITLDALFALAFSTAGI